MKKILNIILILISAGWVYSAEITREKIFGSVTDDDLLMRTYPHQERGMIIARLNRGETVEILSRTLNKYNIDGTSSFWYKVKTYTGKIGWCFGKWIQLRAERYNPLSGFFMEINNGNYEGVKKLLPKINNINAVDNNGRTPLMIAVFRDQGAIVKILLENGAQVNFQDNKGETALMYSVLINNEDIARLLIKKGANVHLYSRLGSTALTLAAYYNRLGMIKLLVAQGAKINVKMKDGSTPLIKAAYRGNDRICDLLLSQGADINDTDNNGRNALMVAIGARKMAVSKLLIEKNAAINSADKNGNTALIWAVYHNQKEIISQIGRASCRERV